MGVFTTRRAERVTFAPDRSWLVLQAHNEAPPGVVHLPSLVRIALPSGDETVLSDTGGVAEPLGSAGAILLSNVGAGASDLAVYDTAGLRPIATGVCDHAATPDGSRVYALHDCSANGIGWLETIDVASRQSVSATSSVLKGSLAVSPSGTWLAYVVRSADGGSPAPDVVQLVSIRGDSEAMNAQVGVQELGFVRDDLLLFRVAATMTMTMVHIRNELLAHVPGTGSTTTVVATNLELGFFGYQVSADGHSVLVPRSQTQDGGPISPGLLGAYSLTDGTLAKTMTDNLLPFWDYQLAINAFGFSAVADYVVYTTLKQGIWSYPLSASGPSQVSEGGMWVLSPTEAKVAILETTGDARANNLRLVALDAGSDVATFASDVTLDDVQFLPDGRGLVFVERRDSTSASPSTLRFMSPSHPNSVALAQWITSLLTSSGPGRFTYPTGSYPVDPTGCFTIADIDGAPGPGTQLILLPE